MYSGVDCFWLEPTGKVSVSLRRFCFGDRGRDCAERTDGGHDASADLKLELDRRTRIDPDGWEMMEEIADEHRPTKDDARWPTVCEHCGEPFEDGDEWQVNQSEVYVRGDNGERVAFRGYGDKEMAGALFDSWWLKGKAGEFQASAIARVEGAKDNMIGPDGLALIAICPNGAAWMVDGPATGGGGWTRTGDPHVPGTLSVTPSIIAGDYHGYLTAGRFTDG